MSVTNTADLLMYRHEAVVPPGAQMGFYRCQLAATGNGTGGDLTLLVRVPIQALVRLDGLALKGASAALYKVTADTDVLGVSQVVEGGTMVAAHNAFVARSGAAPLRMVMKHGRNGNMLTLATPNVNGESVQLMVWGVWWDQTKLRADNVPPMNLDS